MPIRVGSGFLEVLPKLSKSFDRDLEREVNPALSNLGKNLKKTGAIMTATLTPAAAAAGVAFTKAFQQVDAGVDSIRASTGATGQALAGLTQSMENVGSNVTQPLSEVGAVMGDLAARTDLTGPALEGLSTQVLELARITGTDARSSVAALTRVFGDWGVATKDQSRTLDELFRASQATGVPVQRLSELIVQFGAPLRALGFNMTEATALMGRFEAEGVNTELVMGGLRIALGRFTGQGEEFKQEMADLTSQLESADDRVEQLGESVLTANDRLAGMQDNVGGVKSRIGDLSNELKDAKRNLEEALAGASATDVEGASIGVERARLREVEAADAVQEAEQQLADLRKKGASAEEIEDAKRRIESARLSEREAALSAIEAEERLNEVKKQGTKTDPQVVSAREQIRDITQQMADADKDLADAEESVADAQRDVAKAEAELAEAQAERGGIQQTIDSLNALKTANPEQALKATFDAIKNAGSDAEASAIGFEVFGKRAGEDVVRAVREGKFKLDDFTKAIKEGDDTVLKAGDDTKDLSDKLASLTNVLSANVGPFGEWGAVISGAVGFIGPMVFGLGSLAGALKGSAIASRIASIAMSSLPFVAIGIAVAALAYLIYRNWDTIKRVTLQVFGKVRDFIVGVWDKVKGAFRGVIDWVKRNWPTVLAIITGPIGLSVKFIIDNWDKIKEKAKSIFGAVGRILKGAVNGIIRGFNALIGAFENALNGIIRGYNKVADAPIIGALLPHVDEFELPRLKLLASGGHLRPGESAIIGERGPELLQAGRHPVTVQPNAHLANLGGDIVVPVYLDGRQIATAVTPHLRAKRKRDGELVTT